MVESRRVSVLKPRLIPDFSNLVLKLFPLAMGKVSWISKPNSFVPPRPAQPVPDYASGRQSQTTRTIAIFIP